MLNLFKKKEATVKITDKIWMTEAAKFKSLFEEWKKDNSIIYVFWFDETLRSATSFLSKETIEPISLQTIRETSAPMIVGKRIVFAEHYPLQEKEKEVFQKLKLDKVEVWSSLDEPLFKQFGGDRIIQLMQQLGMKEEEVVEHKMISQSIKNAQEKIEKKIVIEQFAQSQKDWIEKNLHD